MGVLLNLIDGVPDYSVSVGDSEQFGSPSPVVVFEHQFFTMFKGAYFRRSEQKNEPVFVVKVVEHDMVLPFRGIMHEFDISPTSADGRMLATVAEALTYVNFLRIGDAVPKELLTGEASWQVPDRIRQIAFHRLTIALATWLTGQKDRVDDPDIILKMAEDPEVRESVNRALGEAAEVLGYGRNNKEKVIQQIEDLAEDSAHIEALRCRFEGVLMMRDKITKLPEFYGNEPGMLEFVLPVVRLIGVAVSEYQAYLDKADMEMTDDILEVLRDVDTPKRIIRKVRNDLYRRLKAWDEMFEAWTQAPTKRGAKTEALLRRTYRFLSPRFMQRDEWVLVTQMFNRVEDRGDDYFGHAWYLDDEHS